MKVEQAGTNFWRVTDGTRTWTVKSAANFGLRYWTIDNSRGTRLAPGGPTGQRIIAAIRAARQ
ncbi:hypothetical protein BKG82_28390 [Mycobacteroides chelonae]|uniref:Uncharacterized protein n=1 Tax=Mycobacteroides chelonae TaxID=1774 RepID=A0A1S1LFM4_MYCCH|nr:hypothetical protein [Mycobacteroides chelonae]OHU46104.1 hypothetical protein BKG82_28390 [Mycobacteroides chelonae]